VSASTRTHAHIERDGGGGAITTPEREEQEDSPREISTEITVEFTPEGKPLVILQVNCRSICNKVLEFWNLVGTYNPDVVIGTESWLTDEINNAELFRGDYITFRRNRCSRGGGVFICVKNHIDCSELWTDDEFEMLAVEIRSSKQTLTWEIIGIYRAPNEDCRVLERLVTRTGCTSNSAKRCITGGDFNLPQVDWNGKANAKKYNAGTYKLLGF